MNTSNLYNDLKKRLESIEKRLVNQPITPSSYKEKEFLATITELEDLVRDKKFSSIAEEVARSTFFKEKCKRIRKIYEIFEVFLETEQYLANLDKKLSIDNNQLKRTFEFAKREGEASGMNDKSHVLFVGSGAFPETALAYALTFNCQVTCLDYNVQAVSLSSKLIEKQGLQNKVKVLYGDATEFNYEGYTHIVVAALAHPKNEILTRICNTCKSAVNIVCRTVEGIRSLIYEPADDLLLEHYDLIEKVNGSSETIVHSLILRHFPHSTKKELEYLPFQSKDAQEVREFCLRIIKEEYNIDYTPEYHTDLDLLGKKDDMYSTDKKGVFLVVKYKNRVVGVGGLRNLSTKPLIAKQFSNRYENKDIGSLWRVYIDKAWRDYGIGTEIVNRLEDVAKKYSYKQIYLHTSLKNPDAVEFWKRKGYIVFLEEDNEDQTVHMDKLLN
ncbi:GNAT family N-acetyltransferase [Candidatus Pacearchaeota archaeon]|nr:GNAT family N-acetyltransferase [Candidatus Pacearchaeota archaeon]